MDKASVLIVDDDREIVGAIAKLLEREGFDTLKAYDGLEALDLLRTNNVQLILLDVMMPKLDGLSATMKIRQERNIPIIILSAKSEDTDKVIGLSMGADDYVTKPYAPIELAARVRAQVRRYTQLGDMQNRPIGKGIQVGGLYLDTETKSLTADGEQVKVTATEYKILELLMRNAGRVFSSEEIYEKVWNEDAYSVENTVAVHIRRIREKMEINAKEPKYLKVVWGIGYKIEKF